jgi:hypothetical protein
LKVIELSGKISKTLEEKYLEEIYPNINSVNHISPFSIVITKYPR